MTVEILPVGIKCNLKCSYCYQEPMREAGNYGAALDLDKVIYALDKIPVDFALFGGEALLTPIPDLERILAYGYKRHGKNGIQTNGLLISDEHIKLFKKYNVQVGVSIDGAEGLNNPRCSDVDTLCIIHNIKHLIHSSIDTSLIVTLHKTNTSQMSALLRFFDDMEKIGIKHINLHNLENDGCNDITMDNDETFVAFRAIYDYARNSKISFNPYNDIKSLLIQESPNVSCIWGGCDPLTTPAVHGISPSGDLVNCGRTNKAGIDWLKSEGHSLERYKALAITEWDDGGCKGCQYFFACKGQCPGTAIDGDWRNRTVDCNFWYSLIDYIKEDLLVQGKEIVDIGKRNMQFIESLSGNNQHSNSPHGDSHGDHTDYGIA